MAYRDVWLKRSRSLLERSDPDTIRNALYEATALRTIDVNGDAAVVHKEIVGDIPVTGDDPVHLDWKTIYLCRKIEHRWRILGFVGYLPAEQRQAKTLPADAGQHTTAGPYQASEDGARV